jgi:hypothetical protein
MNYIECPKCGNREPSYDYAHVCGPLEVKQTNPIRKAFEEVTYLSLRATGHGLRRNLKGEYVSDALEDHWQTFQEGWEEAIKWLQSKDNTCYTDTISDGGMDPRK